MGLFGVALKALEATYFQNRDLLNVPHSFFYNDAVSVIAFLALAILALLFRPQTAQQIAALIPHSSRIKTVRHTGFASYPVCRTVRHCGSQSVNNCVM